MPANMPVWKASALIEELQAVGSWEGKNTFFLGLNSLIDCQIPTDQSWALLQMDLVG